MNDAFDPYHTWLGIPPEDQPPDHYRLLGIKQLESNREVISNALDQRIRHIRSFQTGARAATTQTLLRELAVAGRCLLDEKKKRAYDNQLAKTPPPADEAPARPLPKARALPGASQGGELPGICVDDGRVRTQRGAKKNRMQPWKLVAGAGLLVTVLLALAAWANFGATVASRNAPDRVPAAVQQTLPVPPTADSTAAPDPSATRADPPAPSPGDQEESGDRPGEAVRAEVRPPQPEGGTKAAPPGGERAGQVGASEGAKTETPVDGPPGEEGSFALHFGGKDYVELADTQALLDLQLPFTVELWVRLAGGLDSQWLIGDCVFGMNHPDLTTHQTTGWQLWMARPSAASQRVAVATGRGFLADIVPRDNSWRHVAFCGDGTSLATYVDGRQAARQAVQLLSDEWRASPLNLHLGGHRFLHTKQPLGLTGDIRDVRISSSCRYAQNFEPPPQFVKDRDTIVLLDFAHRSGSRVLDRSGNAHHGTIHGAQWLELPPPSSSQPGSDTPPLAGPPPPIEAVAPLTPEPKAAAQPLAMRRQVAPDDDARAKAEAEIRRIFKEEYERAEGSEAKAALADKLLNLARTSDDDATARFALYSEAHRLALQGGGLALALPIVDEMAAHFEFDSAELKVSALKQVAESIRSPVERRQFAETALTVVDEAIGAESFDLAVEVTQMVQAQATRINDAALRKLAREHRAEVDRAEKLHAAAKRASERLKQEADNPSLHLTWGRFLCFQKRDWDQGLPHLTQGNDARLKQAAEHDLAGPTDPEQQVRVGDLWWEAGESAQQQRERMAMRMRARAWYLRAMSRVSGLTSVRVAQRIEQTNQVAPLFTSSLSEIAWQAVAEAKPKLPAEVSADYVGLVGRLTVDGVDAGLTFRYEPAVGFTHSAIVEVIQRYGVAAGRMQLTLAGILYVPSTTTVAIRQRGGSDAAGVHALYIDRQKRGEIGASRPKDAVYRLTLTQGEHAVTWVLTGGDLGSCQLMFANTETGEPLPVYHNRQLRSAALRSSKARINIIKN